MHMLTGSTRGWIHGAVLLCVARYHDYMKQRYVDVARPNVLTTPRIPCRLLDVALPSTGLAFSLPQAKRDALPILYVPKPTPRRDL